jgi:hypothetical protein
MTNIHDNEFDVKKNNLIRKSNHNFFFYSQYLENGCRRTEKNLEVLDFMANSKNI